MEESEKNQKTVVAFIAGLLIGGLLVWVFFGTGKDDAAPARVQNGASSAQSTGTPSGSTASDTSSTGTSDTSRGDGSITVDDQPAGTHVTIAHVDMPVANGWVAIQEVFEGDVLGRVLGAARYAQGEGLTPSEVELLRATTAGTEYRAVLYAENGDNLFRLGEDEPLQVEDAFTATGTTAG